LASVSRKKSPAVVDVAEQDGCRGDMKPSENEHVTKCRRQ